MRRNTEEQVGRQEGNLLPWSNGADLAFHPRVTTQIEKLKREILSCFEDRLEKGRDLIERALNDAEELSWNTGFPHLLFPELALEKAHSTAAVHGIDPVWNCNHRLPVSA